MDPLRKTFLAGLGALSMSEEMLKKWMEEIIKRGKSKEKDVKNLTSEFYKKFQEGAERFQKNQKDLFQDLLKKFKIPSMDEFNALKKKVEDLEKNAPKSRTRSKSKAKKD